jgi:hypothetical protein
MGCQNSWFCRQGKKIFAWIEGKTLEGKSLIMGESWWIVALEMERIIWVFESEKDLIKYGQATRVFYE